MKTIGFLWKARLCLCLVCGSGLFGCSVFKAGNPVAAPKFYRITAVGQYPLNTGELPDSAVITNWDKEHDEYTLSVKVINDTALEKVLFRLRAAGLWVRSTALVN